jgi:hypothetical protein
MIVAHCENAVRILVESFVLCGKEGDEGKSLARVEANTEVVACFCKTYGALMKDLQMRHAEVKTPIEGKSHLENSICSC